jgi:DNA primase
MARIPESELERLKGEVSLKQLVEGRGVRLKRHGADWIGLCPFHDDREPSLVVSPDKNLWHCLGACGAGGSVIDWVMRAEGVSFRHAVELLRSGAELSGGGRVVKRTSQRKLASPLEVQAGDAELLGQVVGYYHEALKQSPEALAYLEGRGLVNSEMVQRFRLGYANRTLGYRLPQGNRQEGARIRGRLRELGILRKSGHEHFRGSLVIPVFGEQGQVVQMYGRKIGRALRQGTPKHLYLPGALAGVWNVEALQATDEIILCESLIDALTFWGAGYRNVTTSYGVEGFGAQHLEAFERYGARRVLIAYDQDEAGDRAAEALAGKLMGLGMECYRVQFPQGMDANEYASKMSPADRSLGRSIRHAVWMGGPRGAYEPPRLASTSDERLSAEKAAKIGGGSGQDEAPASVPAPETRPAEPSPLSLAAVAGVTEAAEAFEPPEPPGPHPPAPETNTHDEPSEPPVASPLPAAPQAAELAAEVSEDGDEVVIRFGPRRWRVRGLGKNLSMERLKVNLLVSGEQEPAGGPAGAGLHVDTFDLYNARARAAYAKQAASELGCKEAVVKRDLGRVLMKLEGLQEQQIKKALEPEDKKIELSDEEREAALDLLRDEDLLGRILADFEACGVVGEETNKLVGYIAAVSRKLEEPLAVVIQSSSAAGKTALMEAVLAFVPEQERVQYSAMTGQSLFYMGEQDLAHKILAIVEEEGAERASYALKLLQSEGRLTIASTGKDPDSGRLVTHEYQVEGPVMIFLTTTAIEVDEELLNRCLVLTVDEDREQTKKIHRLQRSRQTLEGLLARRTGEDLRKLHQDAQRLIEPLLVANPYAPGLTFTDSQIRTRRDHMKYLTLIRTIALLHQHQRPRKQVEHRGQTVEYIEVSRADIRMANRLAHEVLGRSLDELPPQTRRLLLLLDELVGEACEAQGLARMDYRFTRRQVRERLGWGNTQLKLHLERLADLEYLAVHPKGQAYHYELVYDGQGQDDRRFMSGLIDVDQLQNHEYDSNRSGVKANRSGQSGRRSGTGRPEVGPRSGGGRGGSNGGNGRDQKGLEEQKPKPSQNALKDDPQQPTRSYVLLDPPGTPSSPSEPLPLAAKGNA